jgi:hypothetical protein
MYVYIYMIYIIIYICIYIYMKPSGCFSEATSPAVAAAAQLGVGKLLSPAETVLVLWTQRAPQ